MLLKIGKLILQLRVTFPKYQSCWWRVTLFTYTCAPQHLSRSIYADSTGLVPVTTLVATAEILTHKRTSVGGAKLGFPLLPFHFQSEFC